MLGRLHLAQQQQGQLQVAVEEREPLLVLPGAAVLRNLPQRPAELGELGPLLGPQDASALRAAFASGAIPRQKQVIAPGLRGMSRACVGT